MKVAWTDADLERKKAEIKEFINGTAMLFGYFVALFSPLTFLVTRQSLNPGPRNITASSPASSPFADFAGYWVTLGLVFVAIALVLFFLVVAIRVAAAWWSVWRTDEGTKRGILERNKAEQHRDEAVTRVGEHLESARGQLGPEDFDSLVRRLNDDLQVTLHDESPYR